MKIRWQTLDPNSGHGSHHLRGPLSPLLHMNIEEFTRRDGSVYICTRRECGASKRLTGSVRIIRHIFGCFVPFGRNIPENNNNKRLRHELRAHTTRV